MTKSQRNILITKKNTLYRQTFGFYPCTTSFNAGEQMQQAALVEPLTINALVLIDQTVVVLMCECVWKRRFLFSGEPLKPLWKKVEMGKPSIYSKMSVAFWTKNSYVSVIFSTFCSYAVFLVYFSTNHGSLTLYFSQTKRSFIQWSYLYYDYF